MVSYLIQRGAHADSVYGTQSALEFAQERLKLTKKLLRGGPLNGGEFSEEQIADYERNVAALKEIVKLLG
jgi:hypothetical protein